METELVIIGGGPAGLSAGVYAARADIKTMLLERGVPGGLVINTELIENYPGFAKGISGPELVNQMQKQAKRFGLTILSSNVEKINIFDRVFTIITDSGQIKTNAIIIATGAQPKLLGIKGEKTFTGRGVSYCATCDGPFFRGKNVAVVGGGDAAVQEAIYLTRFAKKVYVIHRRGELRATRVIQQRAFENPDIEFLWHHIVNEIRGKETVDGLILKDVRSGKESSLDAEGVFIYVGYSPNSLFVKDIVSLSEEGYIITDENMQTSQPGIYAAGDVRKKLLRQVVTAVADGAVAAVAAEKYLDELKRTQLI